MATLLFKYRSYEVWLAAFQPSKERRGGHTRSLQIRKNSMVKKTIRYDTYDVYGFSKASKKATDWIDEQLLITQQTHNDAQNQ